VRNLLFILLLAGPALGQDLAALSRAYEKSPTDANRNALLSYAARNQDTGGLALLAVGAHDVAAGRHRAALPHLRAALTRVPKLADITNHLIATAHFATQDHAGAIAAVEPVLTAALRSPVRGSAAVTAARAHLALKAPDRAVALLLAAYGDVPRPAGDVLLGASYEVAGDFNNAVAQYQRAWLEYPASADGKQAEGALTRLRQQLGNAYPQPADEAVLERAVRLMNAREYTKARAEFAEMSARGGAVGDTAAVRVGVAEHRARNYAFAMGYLRGLQVSTPEADAERLYQVVVTARRLNQLDAMDAAVSELGRKYATSEWRAQALAAAGDEYWFLNRMSEAEPFYRTCFEQFPKSPQAAHCSWRAGFMAYLDDRTDAADVLLRHVVRYPGSEKASGALYFLGRGAERQSRWADARAYYEQIQSWYPNYYYGVLARERMKERELARAVSAPAVVKRFAGVAFPAGTEGARFQPSAEARLRFERANLLRTAGLDTFAVSELRFGATTGKQPEAYGMELAREAAKRSAPEQGIRYLKRYAPGYLHSALPRLPADFWRLSFPLPFREPLERHARASGIDAFVVAGLVRQESEFDARAVSSARAYGLTQVLPSTGRDVSRRMGISGYQPARLFDPDLNLRLGTHYLKMLLDQFGGRWEPALASYNAGKSRADAWLKRREYREPAEFVESIPFTETRNYVQSVLRNADIYRRVWGER
jgi:soluble lytic murein transglycosylase